MEVRLDERTAVFYYGLCREDIRISPGGGEPTEPCFQCGKKEWIRLEDNDSTERVNPWQTGVISTSASTVLVALFERYKERIDDQQTPWVFDFCALVNPEHKRQYFWSPNVWHRWDEQSLLIRGEMKWAPPLYIVAKFAELFPSLTFDVVSTTEYGWLEHWRSVAGLPPEQIEYLFIDERDQVVHHYWLKDGETSVFSLPAETTTDSP